jgi:hypothetical protein
MKFLIELKIKTHSILNFIFTFLHSYNFTIPHCENHFISISQGFNVSKMAAIFSSVSDFFFFSRLTTSGLAF